MFNYRNINNRTLVKPWPAGSILASTLLLLGCSSNLQVHEIQKDVKSVAFIQIGNEPHAYEFGVVDGKSFWANANLSAIPSAGTMGISQSAHFAAEAGATLTSDVAKDASEAAVKEGLEAKFHDLIDGSELTSKITHRLMPVLAQTWGYSYDPNKLSIYHVNGWQTNDDGSFSLLDPDTDLVITFGIDKVRLSEKYSIGGIFATVATAGFNEKSVGPELYGRAIVFKRDSKSQALMKVWETSCLVNTFLVSSSEKFSILMESPTIAKPMFEEALNNFVHYCTKNIERNSKS